MAAARQKLDSTIILDGTQHVHFFEGRVLSGRDLRDQQRADAHARHALGQATGAQVVHGLEVSHTAAVGSTPVVTVTAGLAVNRLGEPIDLAHPIELELSRQPPGTELADGILFSACVNEGGGVPASDTLVTEGSGQGFYILTVMPASAFEGSAPKTGLDDGGVAAGCGRRYDTRGKRFALRRVDVTAFTDLAGNVRSEIVTLFANQTPAPASRLRNLVAHAALGAVRRTLAVDPDDPALSTYGYIDDPIGHEPRILSCEVPLALIRWTSAGVRFVDNWAVRRRSLDAAPDDSWPLFFSARRHAEDEARWLQFHDHLHALGSTLNLATIQARNYFRFLPACGVLPLANANTFFAGATVEGPLVVPGAQLADMVQTAQRYPYIDLTNNPTVRLFRMAENQGQPPYLVYQSAEIPSVPWFRDEWATKCAELEAEHDALRERIELLEAADDLASQVGTITGTVSARIFVGAGPATFPLNNVDVTITALSGGQVTVVQTNSLGGFSAPELVPGTYSVGVNAGIALLSSYNENHVLQPNGTLTVNIQLTYQLNNGSVTGVLVNPEAAAGREVRLRDDSGVVVATTTADERGNFEFLDVPQGNYTMSFEDAERRDLAVGINGGTSININVPRRLR